VLYTVSKTPSLTFLAEPEQALLDFNNFWQKCNTESRQIYFSPHITGASAIPCKTGSNEITSLRFSAVCCFANRHTKHKLSTTHRLLLIHKMMDLYVANKTMRGNKASSHLLCSHLAFSMSVIIPCQEQKMLQMTILQLKMHQSQPNIYTLF